jgi:hypothetical protein
MLNSTPGTLVKHTKKKIREKFNIGKIIFLHFQNIKCTYFEINFLY